MAVGVLRGLAIKSSINVSHSALTDLTKWCRLMEAKLNEFGPLLFFLLVIYNIGELSEN